MSRRGRWPSSPDDAEGADEKERERRKVGTKDCPEEVEDDRMLEEEDEGAKPSTAPSQPLASLLAAIHEASNQSTTSLDGGAPPATSRSSSPRSSTSKSSSRSGRRGKQRHIPSSPSHSTPPRPTRTSPRISSRTRSTTSTAATAATPPFPPSSSTSTLPSSTSSTAPPPAQQQEHMPRQAQEYQRPATPTTIASTDTVGAATAALPCATPPEVVVAAMVQNLAGTHVSFPPNSDWATVNNLAGSIAGLAERAGQGQIGPNEVAALQQRAALLRLVMGGVQPAWFYPAPPQQLPQQTGVAAPSAAPLPPQPPSATGAPPGPILTPQQHPPPPLQPAPTLPPLRSLFLPAPPPPQQQPQGRTDQVRSGEDTPARRPHGK